MNDLNYNNFFQDKQEQDLLLDLEDSANHNNNKSNTKSTGGGHTWDNWDDDWEKLEGTN